MNYKKIKPLGKWIFIEPEREELKINLPSTVKPKKHNVATVMAIGPDVNQFKVGDKLLFKEVYTDVLVIDKEECEVISEENVHAKYEV